MHILFSCKSDNKNQLPTSIVTTQNNIKHSFIQYEANSIFQPEHLQPVFEKLNSISNGKNEQLKIVHIGGSHIQADIYTNRIRQNFISYLDMEPSSRGFIFPYTIAETNNPWNYKVSYTGEWQACRNVKRNAHAPMGLSGITATTNDSAATIAIKIRPFKQIPYLFSSLKIYHNQNATIKINPVYPTRNVISEIIKHDLYTEYIFAEEYDSLQFSFTGMDSSNTFELYGFELLNTKPGISYSAIGINGASLESFLKCSLFEKQLQSVNPQLVIISLGTNDANKKYFNVEEYIDNYKKKLRLIRKANPDVCILLTIPNDCYLLKEGTNPHLPAIEERILALAKQEKCAVWNFFELMGGLGSNEEWVNKGLMRDDHVHFTTNGYILKGDLLFEALINGWKESR